MGRHNPNAKTFIQKMNRFEKILEAFLASDARKEALIAHACHNREWLYRHQTLHVRLFPDGTWEIDPPSAWSNGKDCIVLLHQVSYYCQEMEKIGEQRDFETILEADPEEARQVIERLYAQQEAKILQAIRERFVYMRQEGRMD